MPQSIVQSHIYEEGCLQKFDTANPLASPATEGSLDHTMRFECSNEYHSSSSVEQLLDICASRFF